MAYSGVRTIYTKACVRFWFTNYKKVRVVTCINKPSLKKLEILKVIGSLIVIHYSSGVSYYVNNFDLNGTLTSNRFKSFVEADQYFNSQTKKREFKW